MGAEVGGCVQQQRLAVTRDSAAPALPPVLGVEEQKLMGRRFQGIFVLIGHFDIRLLLL